ncbi:serine hydrolase [Chengkuizengella axinellae]|uniref:Serine hydrolase n=1 Tax=Chengkuizengella axinellae TaxID=3064388 RepID=A0ABT9J4J1_9BACL|nr:serine hydrolase [Chengkuizengella sp. 2205SS18-9]MDP5276515.1 serine hydrolase [Chengkuizengella sp. 2205SS18-9]
MKYYIQIMIVFILFYSSIINSFALGIEEEIPEDLLHEMNALGDISFYYENLTTGTVMFHQKEKVYAGASTIKMPLALYIYKKAAEGNLNLDEKLTYSVYHYYEGSGVIQFQPFGTQYTIRDLVQKMIVHSDNVAYIMLTEKMGRANFISFLKGIGGKNVFPNGYNRLSAEDLAIYATALDAFIIEHEELGEELLGVFVHTDYNETIPAGVSGLEVAHKVGYFPLELVYNDVGIVYDEQPYILAIMTEGIPYEKVRDVIAHITKKIHNIHLNLKPIHIYVNGEKVVFPDVQPTMNPEGGTTYVPIRFITEHLGGHIEWDDGTLVLSYNETKMVFNNEYKNKVIINDIEQELNEEIKVRDNRVFVPLRLITDTFGFQITWDQQERAINIID